MVSNGWSLRLEDLQTILKQKQVSDKENKGTSGYRGKNSYNKIFHFGPEKKNSCLQSSVLQVRLAFKSQQ